MLEFIEDLGVIAYGKNGNRRRHWKMLCICGIEMIVPSNNIKSANTTQCKQCANAASAKIKASNACKLFTEKAINVHGKNFDYGSVLYTNSYTHVSLYCNTCSTVFEQTPHSHLQGSGCPSCAINGFNKNKPAILCFHFCSKAKFAVSLNPAWLICPFHCN